MAPPKKTEQLARNASSIRRSKQWRDEQSYDLLWGRMIDLYRGKHYSGDSKEDRIVVNMAFATKNVIAPSVAVNNPKFVVNARRPETAPQAVITEQVLNYLWRTHKYQDEFRLAVDDFLTIGHGWLKVGYKATKPIQVKTLPDATPSGAEVEGVDDRDETVQGNVESEVHSFSDDDRPFLERISPYDIFCDPDARHPKEMKWIAQRTKRPAADVIVDSRYNQSIRVQAGSTAAQRRVDDSTRQIDGQPRQSEIPYVDVWEFYDIRKGKVSTFILNVGDGYLIDPVDMPYAFGHPFIMLRNYEVPDEFYPMGELESIEVLQHELNATRTQMLNHRKRFQRKVLYDKDAFEQEGIDALRDDKDNVLVPVDTQGGATPLSAAIAPMPQMGTPPDFYNQSDLISSDIDRVSGVSDYMRGAQANIRRTATEAAMIQDAMNSRAQDKLSRVESCLALIGERIIQLMQQYMTGQRVVRIVGMRNNPVWVTFDKDYIAGDFDFEVEAGSTQPRNESFRRQSALDMVQAMAPFIQMGVIDAGAIARHVLQFGFEVKDPESFMAPPPQIDPMTGQPVAGPQGAPTPGAPQSPPMGDMGGPPQQADPSASPIDGIPPELVAQLMGSTGLSPNGQ